MDQTDLDNYDVDNEATQEDGEPHGFIREHVAFVIDASENMFKDKITLKDEDPCSCFEFALRSTAKFMRSKLRAGSKDQFAVLFYSTRENKMSVEAGIENVYVYRQMAQPTAATIRLLERLTEREFQEKIGTCKPPADSQAFTSNADMLKSALWALSSCLQVKTDNPAGIGLRVVLFSNHENPMAGQPESVRESVLNRAVTLKDMGVGLHFMPLAACLRSFDLSLFWDSLCHLLPAAEAEEEEEEVKKEGEFLGVKVDGKESKDRRGAVLQQLNSFDTLMKQRLQRRRALSKTLFEITPNLSISCQVYTLVQEAKKPFTIRIYAKNKEEIKNTSVLVNEAGVELERVGHKSFEPNFGKNGDPSRFPRVVFTTEVIASIRRPCPPGLVLLGTKQKSCLLEHHNISHSSFMRPHEASTPGSTTVFKALLDSLVRKERIAICRYVRGISSAPVLVALLPQLEERDELGNQMQPEGLHLIPLPFKEDIRTPEQDPTQAGTQYIQATPEEIFAAAAAVKALQRDPLIGGLSNPALERHFDVLESLALGGNPPDLQDFEDCTKPDIQGLEENGSEALARFKAAVMDPYQGAKPVEIKGVGAGQKRKVPDSNDLSIAEQYALMPNWEEMSRSNKLSKLTVEELKVYLRQHKLPLTGNKPDIIARVSAHATSANRHEIP